MPQIMKYRKITDKYTTYTVNDEENRITELCTINGDTYISVPDDLKLSEQPKQIKLEPVELTDELREMIKEASPHIQLINKRTIENIRKRYTIEDELQIIRNKINGKDVEKYTEYNNYVASCLAIGNLQKDELL